MFLVCRLRKDMDIQAYIHIDHIDVFFLCSAGVCRYVSSACRDSCVSWLMKPSNE